MQCVHRPVHRVILRQPAGFPAAIASGRLWQPCRHDVRLSVQGLRVDCVGMPMHLVNKMGEPDAPDERFIDVFDGGKLLTRLA